MASSYSCTEEREGLRLIPLAILHTLPQHAATRKLDRRSHLLQRKKRDQPPAHPSQVPTHAPGPEQPCYLTAASTAQGPNLELPLPASRARPMPVWPTSRTAFLY